MLVSCAFVWAELVWGLGGPEQTQMTWGPKQTLAATVKVRKTMVFTAKALKWSSVPCPGESGFVFPTNYMWHFEWKGNRGEIPFQADLNPLG